MARGSGRWHWNGWPWWVRALAVAAGVVVLAGVALLVLPAPRWVQIVAAGLVTGGLVVLLSYTPKKWFSGWPWWARALAVAAGGVVLAGLVLAVWKLPPLLYDSNPGLLPKDRADAESSTRTGLIAGLAGLAALGSLVVTSRTYRVTEQGHITDRYTKAIAQLGDDKLDIRLGGIYALERLAVDSARDHPTVVEVLSAFVRERSRPDRIEKPSIAEVLQSLLADSELPTPAQAPASPPRPAHPSTDLQAALTVLGRLPNRDGVSRGDLSGADLAGASLGGANLTGAHLDDANLTGAHLDDANLTGAHLLWADLTRANLSDANLTDANLGRANLTGASLLEANLTGASLQVANLSGATLIGANLADASLSGANLAHASLSGANLAGASLSGANLAVAVGLEDGQIAVARGDVLTRLPKGLTWPGSWPSWR